MSKNSRSKYIRIVSHLMFWVVAYFFFVVFFGRANRDYSVTVVFASMLFPLSIGTTYFVNYYLIPGFLFTRKYFQFALFSVYTLIVSIWLELLISLAIFVFIGNYQMYKIDPASFDVVLLFVGLYFIIIVATAIMLVRRFFQFQKRNKELDKRKFEVEIKLKEAELKLLKAQIHPHFLFNTLNNLYGLTLEKSDDAPNLVLRLSDILDYILYRCNEKQVPLSEEISNLKNYTEIEKIRYSDKLILEFNFPDNTGNLTIAPLILLPFVENAFKHGVSKITGNSYVKIYIELEGKLLLFKIENSNNTAHKTGENYSKGIGLKNVIKRLDLMYPQKHTLSIENKPQTFLVDLKLQLEN